MAIQKLEQFEVKSSLTSYKVKISDDLSNLISDLSECKFYIIDSYFKASSFVKNLDSKMVLYIDANEEAKTLKSSEVIIDKMTELKISRDSKIAVIGGGIIQDVGGFVSSIYMRGIDYKLYPTTYLSMVDSCIGGKTSINTGKAKNLLGTFFPPSEVFCFINFCKTLNTDQINQGLIEALKISYAYKDTFEEVFKLCKEKSHGYLQEISLLSLFSKKMIIEEDEFDMGKRRLLNLGHTFGHSIEKASSHQIEHGYAVGLGILIATNYSLKKEYIDNKHNINKVCKMIISLLPMKVFKIFKDINIEILFESLKNDKKHNDNLYKFILPYGKHIKEVEFNKNHFDLHDEFETIIKEIA